LPAKSKYRFPDSSQMYTPSARTAVGYFLRNERTKTAGRLNGIWRADERGGSVKGEVQTLRFVHEVATQSRRAKFPARPGSALSPLRCRNLCARRCLPLAPRWHGSKPTGAHREKSRAASGARVRYPSSPRSWLG